MSGYVMTLDSESNRRTRAANDLGIIQHSHPDGNVSRDADSALELQVPSHLLSHADDNKDEDKDDNFGCLLAPLSGDFMEREFGSDTILEKTGKHEGKWKLVKVPSWTSTASIEFDASHTDCGEVATEIPATVHLPPAPVAHLGRCENTDEGFGLVEEDGFGFENKGYIIESSGEDSGSS